MDGADSRASAGRLANYLNGLTDGIGHAARVGPMRDYCTGLLMPCERKSVEPMAAATAPARASAQHQALLHFVGEGAWSDEAVLAKVREMVLPQIERHGAISAWILDDTGFPKHGSHSVGVTHQYCGQLGKQTNCQAAVSLSVANRHASLPVAFRLYLPKSWAEDETRRKKAGVPADIAFKTKPKIALDQLKWACHAGIPRGAVLMDQAYGTDASLRRGARDLGLDYCAAVPARSLVEAVKGGAGEMPAEDLAARLFMSTWRTITWRQGAAGKHTLAVCPRACVCPGRRLHARRARRMALDRMARGRGQANQVLALEPARSGSLWPIGRYHDDALADRMRLPGA